MFKVIDIAFIKLMNVEIATFKFSISAANDNRIILFKTKNKDEKHSHWTQEEQSQEWEKELSITWVHVWLRWRVKTVVLARDRIKFIQFDVFINIWFARYVQF